MLTPALGLLLVIVAEGTDSPSRMTRQEVQSTLENIQANIATLTSTVKTLSRQAMLQQFYVEDISRSSGNSGVKRVRDTMHGTKPYFEATHTSQSALTIHNHVEYEGIAGIAEFTAVLNGVEFRTRQGGYKVKMPDTQSKTFHKVVDIPYPDVPPSVLEKGALDEQIEEMRTYFKAFKLQDPSIKDYRPFFKPVLCYLEGVWTSNDEDIEDTFRSEHEGTDHYSLDYLMQRIRYNLYTGGDHNRWYSFYRPTGIIDLTEDGLPIIAQWTHRIVCHPIQHELMLQDFRVVDELSTRARTKISFLEYAKSAYARFTLAPKKGSKYNPETGSGQWEDHAMGYGLLDILMGEIPGKDNYPGHHTGSDFGLHYYTQASKNKETLDIGRYHRMYKFHDPRLDMIAHRHRGFSDDNLWVAANDRPEVLGMSLKDCSEDESKTEKCTKYTAKYSYAIPLEIIWLTPLHKWNPHNISHTNHYITDGRTGGSSVDESYNGTASNRFYRTPAKFFEDPKESMGVLDQNGKVNKMVASGMYVFTPQIPGVGQVRTRYPIAPIHGEGSTVWKDLAALKDSLMDKETYNFIFEN